jgi:hypothetical protein
MGDAVYGEGGRVGRLSDIDCALVALEIVEAIGHSTSHGIPSETMHVDRFWFLAPHLTWVLEIADQFFLLGVNTENGLSGSHVFDPLLVNVLKLTVPIRMSLTRQLFHIGS